jgi:hypothetical protein
VLSGRASVVVAGSGKECGSWVKHSGGRSDRSDQQSDSEVAIAIAIKGKVGRRKGKCKSYSSSGRMVVVTVVSGEIGL